MTAVRPDRAAEAALSYIRGFPSPVTIMEVCGTHTAAVVRGGLRSLLPAHVRLVSGPGCPVCVTEPGFIDALIGFAGKEDACVLTFGDLMRVRGSALSLAEAKALGAAVSVVYSPLEAVKLAKNRPDTQFCVAAVGFETTAPLYALLLDTLCGGNIKNATLCCALKTMPGVMDALARTEAIDGFICPGHVSVVTGTAAYRPLLESCHKPLVIAGFAPEDILLAVAEILRQLEQKTPRVTNLYPSFVTEDGNAKAREAVARYFEPCDAEFRGLGRIEGGGLRLKDEYARYRLDVPAKAYAPPEGCRCADVLRGRLLPPECPLFGSACTPEAPAGACMVSREGACGVYYTGGL